MPVRQVIVRNPLRKLVHQRCYRVTTVRWAGSLTAGVRIPQLTVSWASARFLRAYLGLGDTGRDRWGHCTRGCGCLGQVSSQLPLEDVGWGSLHHGGGKEVPLRDGAVNEGVLQLSCPPWLGFEFVAVLLPCSGVTVFQAEHLLGDSNFSIHDLVHERQSLVLPPLLECWPF